MLAAARETIIPFRLESSHANFEPMEIVPQECQQPGKIDGPRLTAMSEKVFVANAVFHANSLEPNQRAVYLPRLGTTKRTQTSAHGSLQFGNEPGEFGRLFSVVTDQSQLHRSIEWHSMSMRANQSSSSLLNDSAGVSAAEFSADRKGP